MRILQKEIIRKFFLIAIITVSTSQFSGCGDGNSSETTPGGAETPTRESAQPADPSKDIGIGPIKEIMLAGIDNELVNKGQEIFEAKCTACHKIGEKYIGPALAGVTERRAPEWIMNMILNPEQMVKENPVAMELFEKFLFVPMANQSLTEEEARAVLEFFRTQKSSNYN